MKYNIKRVNFLFYFSSNVCLTLDFYFRGKTSSYESHFDYPNYDDIFWDVNMQIYVLLFINNIFYFVQVESKVSPLLSKMSFNVSNQPTPFQEKENLKSPIKNTIHSPHHNHFLEYIHELFLNCTT